MNGVDKQNGLKRKTDGEKITGTWTNAETMIYSKERVLSRLTASPWVWSSLRSSASRYDHNPRSNEN